MNWIESLLLDTEKLHIIVDALDESAEAEAVVSVLKSLLDSEKNKRQVNVFMTSRFEVQIEQLVQGSGTFSIPIMKGIREVVEQYIDSEINTRTQMRTLKLRDPNLAPKLRAAVTNSSNGLYENPVQRLVCTVG